jgi:hypothetical protein
MLNLLPFVTINTSKRKGARITCAFAVSMFKYLDTFLKENSLSSA